MQNGTGTLKDQWKLLSWMNVCLNCSTIVAKQQECKPNHPLLSTSHTQDWTGEALPFQATDFSTLSPMQSREVATSCHFCPQEFHVSCPQMISKAESVSGNFSYIWNQNWLLRLTEIVVVMETVNKSVLYQVFSRQSRAGNNHLHYFITS
jgi:hypothetical protein